MQEDPKWERKRVGEGEPTLTVHQRFQKKEKKDKCTVLFYTGVCYVKNHLSLPQISILHFPAQSSEAFLKK